MNEISRISNDCRFTYMLDFILKPGGRSEYEDVSLLKFKGNPGIDTCQEPITRSVQLPHIRATAFSQVSLFLDTPFPRKLLFLVTS